MPWEISTHGEFADIGVIGCTATFQNGGNDSCMLTIARDVDASGEWEEGDAVTITSPSGTFFQGIVSGLELAADGGSEHHILTLSSRWKLLEEIVYLQPFASGELNATKYKSRVILGIDNTGARQTSAGIIASVLAYANTQGASIPLGGILSGVTLTPPQFEMVDATCAEVIRQVMRWHPDCVVYFDHAGGGGLHIVKAADLPTVSRSSAGQPAARKTPRSALSRGVVIHYERSSVVNGQSYTEIVDDSAGVTTGPRVNHFTIPLRGPTIVTQEQAVETMDIPASTSDPNLGDWLKLKFPEIAEANPGPGEIEVLSIKQTVKADEAIGPGSVLASYPRELIKGAIQPWMTGVSAAPVTVTVRLKFTGAADDNPDLYALFTGAHKVADFQVELMGTDALDQTYRTASGGGGETVPTGLAAAVYAAMSAEFAEGGYTHVGAEPDLALMPGRRLALTGPVAVTASPIQSSSVDVFSGRVSVAYGPQNGNLSPMDWLELQRAGERTRPLVNYPLTIRSDSTAAASGAVTGATGGRVVNSTRRTPPPSDLFFACKPGGSGKIKVEDGAVALVYDNEIRQEPVSGGEFTAGDGDKIYCVVRPQGAGVVAEIEVRNGIALDEGHFLIAEIESDPTDGLTIKQRHLGVLGVPMPKIGGLQLVTKSELVGGDLKWFVGVTYGAVTAESGTVCVPELQPGGVPLDFAEPVYFAAALDATDAREVWLKIIKDDTDPFEANVTDAEIHLLTAPPSPLSSTTYQWVQLGETGPNASGTRHIAHSVNSGNLRVVRMGGPGAGYRVYSA